jgi:hypothetical protein
MENHHRTPVFVPCPESITTTFALFSGVSIFFEKRNSVCFLKVNHEMNKRAFYIFFLFYVLINSFNSIE